MLVAIHPTSLNADSIKYGAYNSYSPQCIAYYFDFEAKLWKPLLSVAQSDENASSCVCAERIGNYLFVAKQRPNEGNFIHRYDVVNNSWVKLPKYGNNHVANCLCSVGDYLYAINESNPLQRYSLTNNSWQGGEGLKVVENREKLSTVAATVMNSKIYVIHGYQKCERGRWVSAPAVVHCFDPKYNVWTKLASTCDPRLGSSLFVVNNRLCVAGGNSDFYGSRAPVEVYDEGTNTWSVVPQKHIPPNDLGAVEIEGRVYFIINNFQSTVGLEFHQRKCIKLT